MIFGNRSACSRFLALLCMGLMLVSDSPGWTQSQAPPQPTTNTSQEVRSAPQLDSLVSPIALYPDPLLAQVLAASTYPLDIVEASRWLKENSNLKGEQLTQAATQQPWEASVQALVAFPDALRLLDDNIKWTTELGNAVLDQQEDVLDAVQRMRLKAKESGKLDSTKEQKVETKTIESKTIVEIQPADPQVIYVPSYEPEVIYGAPAYPYPAMYYPPASYAATALVSFGLGVAVGHYWNNCCGGGGWGWNCNWNGGHNNININNNFYNRYNYNNRVYSGDRNGNGNWQHDSQYRKSVPYSNRDTAQKYGGSTRDASGRTERIDNRGGGQQGSGRDIGANLDRSSQRSGNSPDFGGGDRMGNRTIDKGAGNRQNNAFGGMDSRQRTQAASDRGFNSSRERSSGASANRGSSASRGSFGGSRGGAGRAGGGRRR